MLKTLPVPAAALILASAAPAAAQTAPAPVQPARWHLDGATDRCVLTRRLEGTPTPATFILRTIPGSGRYDIILAAPDLPGGFRRSGRLFSLSLAPGGQARALRAAPVDLPPALGEGAVFAPLPPAIADELARATIVQVADDQGRALGSWAIPLGARAAEALAYCEAEKLVEWGAD
ncbi:MAG: hypothetical protein QOI38_2876, partial [Sphingomonadales bacterium]|nr:hypothetical protein [Sphingomonadales bacterium]